MLSLKQLMTKPIVSYYNLVYFSLKNVSGYPYLKPQNFLSIENMPHDFLNSECLCL